MKELILIGVFIAATILGSIIIKKVPSLLHTPLMSGMNALSGVTVLGALIVAATTENSLIKVLACAAVALAMINVAGGFAVTAKMLNMFKKRKHTGGEEA